MMTGTTYRGHRLTRNVGTMFWKVDDAAEERLWNQTLAFVDSVATEPPVETYFCTDCGYREVAAGYYDSAALMERGVCRDCRHWLEAMQDVADKPTTCFVAGATFYSIGDETAQGPTNCRGYGGRKFAVRWRDGRRRQTTNLWCGGDVPLRWRARLPNTAELDAI